ncbi:ribonuclease VapC [Deinococcus aerius]|uniref:Ribonuclease VapC n=1 Tax=Deinococcus aerius TaxID=200253 RepID=A0A2I9CVJ1_9DEIO|nr:TA system VapC family ribonuclease toxin [Deinococcus aerius]GBF05964.1 ribonuclease VapC [Deinococcus aerius]
MSYLLDANVLICAFQTTQPHHPAFYRWLRQALTDGETLYSTSLNEVALARISTRVYNTPPEDVFEFLADLHAQPSYRLLELGKAGLSRWRQLVLDLNLRGNDLNDAYLAALALEHRLTLVTADQGFARFAGVRVFTPT